MGLLGLLDNGAIILGLLDNGAIILGLLDNGAIRALTFIGVLRVIRVILTFLPV
jgi:hypothetical protein